MELWFLEEEPWLKPHEGNPHGNPHAVDRGHLTSHDFRFEFDQLVKENNLLFEEHETTTEDGYILKVFRVRNPKFVDANRIEPQPVVFFQHGICDTADVWVTSHGDEAPAFVFANEGYDVWLGNQRGSANGRKHVSLDPDGHRDER